MWCPSRATFPAGDVVTSRGGDGGDEAFYTIQDSHLIECQMLGLIVITPKCTRAERATKSI
eukprot:scaffold890_cov112-Skeletonema_dohrnii-CCMP3373.AAC.2